MHNVSKTSLTASVMWWIRETSVEVMVDIYLPNQWSAGSGPSASVTMLNRE